MKIDNPLLNQCTLVQDEDVLGKNYLFHLLVQIH